MSRTHTEFESFLRGLAVDSNFVPFVAPLAGQSAEMVILTLCMALVCFAGSLLPTMGLFAFYSPKMEHAKKTVSSVDPRATWKLRL
jgi:hypothetical protein